MAVARINYTCNLKPHQCNPNHYNGNPQKNQWKPKDYEREFILFDKADLNGWYDGSTDYWAVEVDDHGNPNTLGVDWTGVISCRLSRFRQDVQTSPWHGYPITLRRKGEKLPPIGVIEMWLNAERGLKRGWKKKIIRREV